MTSEQMLELRKYAVTPADHDFLNYMSHQDLEHVRWVATTNPHVSYALHTAINRMYQESVDAR